MKKLCEFRAFPENCIACTNKGRDINFSNMCMCYNNKDSITESLRVLP